MFRKLREDEIEVRVGSVMKGAATLLLYKDARCDMNILDETVGQMNWKREHSRDNRNCTVSIWDKEKEQWISKEDTGTESNTEKEKGLASDSFKRACVNWGIGRELYTSPRIRISCETKEKSNGNGYELKDKWKFFGAFVSQIEYDDSGAVAVLEIVKGRNVIYSYDGRESSYPEVEKGIKEGDDRITTSQAQTIMQIVDEKGADRAKFLEYYEIADFTHMTKSQYGDALNKLAKKGQK